VAVHGIEIPGTGQAVLAVQLFLGGQAESRLRPRALRRFRIARPGLAEAAEQRGFDWVTERVGEVLQKAAA